MGRNKNNNHNNSGRAAASPATVQANPTAAGVQQHLQSNLKAATTAPVPTKQNKHEQKKGKEAPAPAPVKKQNVVEKKPVQATPAPVLQQTVKQQTSAPKPVTPQQTIKKTAPAPAAPQQTVKSAPVTPQQTIKKAPVQATPAPVTPQQTIKKAPVQATPTPQQTIKKAPVQATPAPQQPVKQAPVKAQNPQQKQQQQLTHQDSFFGSMFDTPTSWESICKPVGPPMRSAVQPKKQPATTIKSAPMTKETTAPKQKQTAKKGNQQKQPVNTYANVLKKAIATEAYARMQLVVRPKTNGIVIYRSLVSQLLAWAHHHSIQQRGRTLSKNKSSQKRQGAPVRRQESNIPTKPATAPIHTLKKPVNLQTKKRSGSNSSPTGNTPDVWAAYISPPKSAPNTTTKAPTTVHKLKEGGKKKNKKGAYMSPGNPSVHLTHAASEGSNVLIQKMARDVEQMHAGAGGAKKKDAGNTSYLVGAGVFVVGLVGAVVGSMFM
ncbi:hypothetical protein HDV05_001201 [Chytridiales sp. JEL 0842]|nr:hypothetical protein HDV05_001201 [Chytridiales sp. JEL 0842]